MVEEKGLYFYRHRMSMNRKEKIRLETDIIVQGLETPGITRKNVSFDCSVYFVTQNQGFN